MTANPVENHGEGILKSGSLDKNLLMQEQEVNRRNSLNVRVLAAGALVLEFVLDFVGVTASDHGQLRMHHCGLASIQLPKRPVPVPDTINEPRSSMTHLMNQCVSETIYRVEKLDWQYDVMIQSNISKHKHLLCMTETQFTTSDYRAY